MSEHAPASGHLRPLTEDDLGLVLAWRNHPEIRRHMYHQHEIGAEEHRRWFAHCQAQSGRHLLLFEEDGQPLGFVNLAPSRFAGCVDWGFYAAPMAPRGTGRRLGAAAMDFAFGQLGLHKVCGEALAGNERSLRLHEALGFRQEGVLREQFFDGTHYHSVVCLGLLGREWRPPA